MSPSGREPVDTQPAWSDARAAGPGSGQCEPDKLAGASPPARPDLGAAAVPVRSPRHPHAGWPGLPPAVHAAYVAALARRAAVHGGTLRALLEQKLSESRSASVSGAVAPVAGATPPAGQAAVSAPAAAASRPAPSAARRRPGPLAELTARLNRAAGEGEVLPSTAGLSAATAPAEPAELKSLQRDRAAWARLSVEQELQRALAQVPANPGPLNPHLLVLRSLRQLQALSPAYLARFVSQVETLIWLERVSFGTLPARPVVAKAATGANGASGVAGAAGASARRVAEPKRKRSRGGKPPATGRA